MVLSQNLLLVGLGIPTKRWGSTLAFQAGPDLDQHVFRGIAMSGLEFGYNLPGALNIDYFESSQNTFNYYNSKGFNIIRLPFLWERAQPTLGGSFASVYMGYIQSQITDIGNSGMQAILDMHNYGLRTDYYNGGITEPFSENLPSLVWPYSIYSQLSYVVLDAYGESLLGTFTNPVSGATGYNVSFNMDFLSRDNVYGGEGFRVRPMWQSDTECYEVRFDYADSVYQVSSILNGSLVTLASGSYPWSLATTYPIVMDINQTTYGKFNCTVGGSALWANNTVNSTVTLAKGKVGFYAEGMHVELSNLILNIAGDTSSGGFHSYPIGSPQIPISDFSTFWGIFAGIFAGNANVYGYDLMNEPHNMPIPTHLATSPISVVSLSYAAGIVTATTSGAHGYALGDYVNMSGASISNYNGSNLAITSTPTTTQYQYSLASVASPTGGNRYSLSPTNYNTTATVTNMMQQAITAIRAVPDTTHYIIAETDVWAGIENFTSTYGTNPTPWWTDPSGLLIYSFHYYFDNDNSGSYALPFASSNNTNIPSTVTPMMSWAQAYNITLYGGEYGVPAITAWQVCLTTFLGLCDNYNVHASYWAGGDYYTAITTIQPTGSYPNYVDAMQMAIVESYPPYTIPGGVSTRLVLPVKDINNNIQILAWTDAGYLTKQSGGSYAIISGYSWASGYNLEGAELGNRIYLVNGIQPLVKYDFNTLLSFTSLLAPTNVTASNVSGVIGTQTFSWAVTATSAVGETLPSTPISVTTLPYELNTDVRIYWSAPTVPSGATLTGYNIYRILNEGSTIVSTFVGNVGPTITQFDDTTGTLQYGNAAPTVNSTGGPVCKWVIRFQDRLIYAGFASDPTVIQISAEYPAQDRLDIALGGGVLWIEPDSGEDITGLGVYYRTISATQTVVVFKEKSVWEVVLDTATVSGYNVLQPSYRLLTASQGCTSHRSITPVENDVFFINTRGIYILRYEPNLYNVVNADELSAKIRPWIQALAYNDIAGAAGFYADKKYLVSFPVSKQAIVFDRERLAFTGPWKFPWALNMWRSYFDATGQQHWLAASGSNNNVYEFSANYPDDAGTPIATVFKSRREVFNDWTLFKSITEVFFNFQNIVGNVKVNIYIENRQGQVVTAKTFTLTGVSTLGTSGIGIDQLGTIEVGLTSGIPSASAQQSQYRALLYQTARTLQVEIDTYDSADNYNLLNVKSIGLPQSRDNAPASWTV